MLETINTNMIELHFQCNNQNLKNSLTGSSRLLVSSSLKEITGVDMKQKPGLLTAFKALRSTSSLVTWMRVSTFWSMFSCLYNLRIVSRLRVSCT